MNQRKTEWRNFIPSGGVNDAIEKWHAKQPPREQTCASPSTLTECPRVVWFKKKGIEPTNDMGWGQKQRMLLGRNFEDKIAEQLEGNGLLYHWKDTGTSQKRDNPEDMPVPFVMGEGDLMIKGTPDLLLSLEGRVLISDAKTSRADSFAYVPIDDPWDDELWYKYKLQVECYYLLCHKNKEWFKENKLLLPEACHLFSFALDDGVIKREYTWTPTKDTAQEIFKYAQRWNRAYQSETMPECECTETQTKFCRFATETERTRSGYKLGTRCCEEVA